MVLKYHCNNLFKKFILIIEMINIYKFHVLKLIEYGYFSFMLQVDSK
jgi:hypothetical protein